MKEPIRVLHILQRMEAAGVQTFLMNIYRQIDRSKVQFDFLVHYDAPEFFDKEIEELGGKVYRLSFREDYNLIKYIRNLNSFFNEHKEFRIVHGHMHSLGAIYLNIAARHGVPVRIAHSHTNNTQNDFKKYFKLIMNNLYSKYSTDLFACSEAAGKYMFKNKAFKIINNAIDSDRFIFSMKTRDLKRKELGIEDKFVIGCVGRFEKQKNQKFSIQIFEEFNKKYPDSVLILIGSGSMEIEMKELVKNKGLENYIIFLGNRKDINELYQAMDVFLFPSLFEGLGIVAVEAQASGIPVVCTDTLPKEIDITPLINRISLDCSINKWCSLIEKSYENENKYKNMKSYIEKAEYDIKILAKKLSNFI